MIIKPIAPDQVAQAYPLVQAIEPGLTLERWRAHIRELTERLQRGGRGGIMSLQTPEGYIHGLFAYEVADDLRCGRTLNVGTVVAFHVGEAAEAARQMMQAIEAVARQNACSTIQIKLPIEDTACAHRPGMRLGSLGASGYRPAFTIWCKRFLSADNLPDRGLDP